MQDLKNKYYGHQKISINRSFHLSSKERVLDMFFFDFDGPILDVSDRYFTVYAHTLRECGGDPLSKAEYWNLKRNNISEMEIISKTLEKKRIVKYLLQRKILIEDPSFLSLDRIWPDLLSDYKTILKKYPAILVTLRSNPQNLQRQLIDLGIGSWFHQVLSHSNIDMADDRWKIKVQLIQKSKLLNKIKPNESIFFGDTETDILTGKALGMKTVAISFGIRNQEILLKYQPDLIFDTPNDFSQYLKRCYI